MNNNRKKNAAMNFLFATLGNVLNAVLAFVSRTVFIYSLGTLYNGVNGLYSNVLGMLSLAELGVSNAISFSLYKPLAENDIKKIQAIMNFYRRAYRVIAVVIFFAGIAIIPFFDVLIKGGEGVDHLVLYYLIFLFNTVTSYLLVYKTTLVEADQKSYLITRINMIIKSSIGISQIIVLLLWQNYLIYLLIGMVVQLLGNVYINFFCGQKYKYLNEKNSERLSSDDRKTILTKIKALMAHKIGEKAVTQTDNIIISSFINVTTVGLVANYTMIISLVNTFIISFFYSASAAIGNIIATESISRKKLVLKRYDFLGFVFFGWSALCLYFVFPPFISIWIGTDKLVAQSICFLLCLNYYLNGIRQPVTNFKNAAGVFEQDKWVPIVQALLNLIVSITGAKYLGLVGVYIGTLVSSLVPLIIRPIVVYKYVLKCSAVSYFYEQLYAMLQMTICMFILDGLFAIVNIGSYIGMMIFRILMCSIVIGLVIIVFNLKNESFHYAVTLTRGYLRKLIHK